LMLNPSNLAKRGGEMHLWGTALMTADSLQSFQYYIRASLPW
jgi:hypothetical protein